jgi:glucokinase
MMTQPDSGQKSSRASYADGPRLLADIGATHARFTLETAPGVFRQTAILRCDDYDGIVPLLNPYLTEQRGDASRMRRSRWPIRSAATWFGKPMSIDNLHGMVRELLPQKD